MLDFKIQSYLNHLKEDKFTIFLFHGVTNQRNIGIRNYTRKHIYEEDFDSLILKLSQKGNAISLDDAIESWNNKKTLPKYSYAISFDDGFENNLKIALPILEKYRTPSIFYITTKFISENSLSWVDKIEAYIDAAHKQIISFDDFCKDFKIDDYQSKINFMNLVRNFVKNTEGIDADNFAVKLCKLIKLYKKPTIVPILDNKLSWSQLNQMKNNSLVTLGGHSHTHRIMSNLTLRDLQFEVSHSLGLINKNLKLQTHHFSYPEGMKNSFNEQVIKVLKNNGIKICPTAIQGYNSEYSDYFNLKRVNVF